MGFVYTLTTLFAWGGADIFYKKSASEKDRYSHLKTAMIVGFVMGAHALFTLFKIGFDYNPRNLLIYLPVSAMYILSMTIGYLGLRYLELSISSPIQNSSGAVTAVLCFLILGTRISGLSLVGVILVSLGLVFLGILEKVYSDAAASKEKKYRTGAFALSLPVLYCIIDALGTFFDAYYLDDVERSPLLGVTADNLEDIANLSYELTFLLCALVIFFILKCIKKEPLPIKDQGNREVAALLETVGQATYVYALSANPLVAAPVISTYSIISLILSRIFLKEKLTKLQYLIIGIVIAGIVILGFEEI